MPENEKYEQPSQEAQMLNNIKDTDTVAKGTVEAIQSGRVMERANESYARGEKSPENYAKGEKQI